MESVRVYRSVNNTDRFFGLELIDGAVMLLVFFLAFMFNREGLFSNAGVLVLAYFGMRALKRNKPEGYVLDLTRHVLSNPFKGIVEFNDYEQISTEKIP